MFVLRSCNHHSVSENRILEAPRDSIFTLGFLVFPPLGLRSPQRHVIIVTHKMLANTILPELKVHDFTRHCSLKVLPPAPHSFADGWVERLLAPSAACSTAEVRHERRGARAVSGVRGAE